MRKKTVEKITESVIPVILLLSAIFFILFYVQYRASEDAERTYHIHVTAETSAQNQNNQASVAEVDFSDDPRISQAQVLIQKGKFSKAEDIYLVISRKEPSAQIQNLLGMLYMKEEKYDKAVLVFTKALKINKAYYKARYNRALSYNALNKYAKAEADYKAVIRSFDAHAKSHFNLGLLYYKQDKFMLAADEFEKTTTLSAGDIKVKALHMLGQSYSKMSPRKVDEAIAAFKAAIRLQPDHVASRLALIDFEYPADKEGYEDRLNALEVMVKLEPENIDIYRAISQVYRGEKQDSRALDILKEALLHEPDNIDLQYEVIELLMVLRRDQEAVTALEHVLTVLPTDSNAYLLLGRLYYRQQAYEAALDAYNIVLAVDKEDRPELWNNLGLLYTKMDRMKDAKKAYEKALKMRPGYPEVYYNLGQLSLVQGELKKAESYFEEAIRLRPDYFQAYNDLAEVFSRLEAWDKAIDAYAKVLANDPESVPVRFNLAVSYSKYKAYEKAEAIYEQILAEDESYFSAWLNIGIVYYDQKKYDRSRKALEKAVALEPDDAEAYRALAKTYSALTENDKAINILVKLLEQNPSDIETRLAYALAYYRANQFDKALNEYHKVLSLDPENSVALKMIKTVQSFNTEQNSTK